MAFDQMGLPCTVSVSNGAGTFENEWIDEFEQFDTV